MLTFADGQVSNLYSVTIINDQRVDPNLTFTNLLFNAAGGAQLLFPSNQTVTITNDLAGFSFSSSAYSVTENGVFATITVVRTGATGGTNSVSFATANGTAQAGNQYQGTNGTLVFTNGQTSATFNVPIIDKNITGGTETVLLSLSGPTPGSVLVNPSASILTILNNDGSLILPAGAALLSGSTNGAINPGGTVTLLLALRNAAGTNTGNLMARCCRPTELPRRCRPRRSAMAFWSPTAHPCSVPTRSRRRASTVRKSRSRCSCGTVFPTWARPFTRLRWARPTNSFTNNSLIGLTMTPATPYPAVLNVSGVIGTVNKITATVSNLSHGSISDVCILLTGPTGTNTLLMANVGGGNIVNDLDLTFDDAGPALPASRCRGRIVQRNSTRMFRSPPLSNGPGLLPKPFGTTLSVFTNTNPNGVWSMYVLDDVPVDSGDIFNGFSLNFITLGVVTPTADLVAGLTAAPIPWSWGAISPTPSPSRMPVLRRRRVLRFQTSCRRV